jgi:hypothetical protein
VVLVALDHSPHAIDEGFLPRRIVGRVVPPLQREEAVRLEVALVDHVQPELVAEVEEARVRRVVARAHGVDVVGLHQLDVAPHHVLGHRAPRVGIELVAVDAVQLDAVPVDQQQPVLDHNPAEADLQQHPLAPARHDRLVQPRDLGAPRVDALDPHRFTARDVDPQLRHRHPHVVRSKRVHAQAPRARHVVVVRVHEQILDASRRPQLQRDVAEDPRQPPHVLVL